MDLRQRKEKRKTGLKLLLLVVLVMCGVLTYSTGKAKEKERELKQEWTMTDKQLTSAKEQQEELEEEQAYRQTKGFWVELARKMGLVMPDEVLLRKSDDSTESEK